MREALAAMAGLGGRLAIAEAVLRRIRKLWFVTGTSPWN